MAVLVICVDDVLVIDFTGVRTALLAVRGVARSLTLSIGGDLRLVEADEALPLVDPSHADEVPFRALLDYLCHVLDHLLDSASFIFTGLKCDHSFAAAIFLRSFGGSIVSGAQFSHLNRTRHLLLEGGQLFLGQGTLLVAHTLL